MLDSVGLAERKGHRLSELSGGEQQRVAIAVALANDPVLLLADEPTGEVDTNTALGIFELLNDLNRRHGLTTIIVSHDPDIARRVDRVVAIRDGKTSSETVRQSAQKAKGEVFNEVVLVEFSRTSPGPREYLEQFHIHGRVHLEAREDGILIRPASGNGSENRFAAYLAKIQSEVIEPECTRTARLVEAFARRQEFRCNECSLSPLAGMRIVADPTAGGSNPSYEDEDYIIQTRGVERVYRIGERTVQAFAA